MKMTFNVLMMVVMLALGVSILSGGIHAQTVDNTAKASNQIPSPPVSLPLDYDLIFPE